MAPPSPSPEACERAWELYAHHGWRTVAELLRKEGYPCGSHETARQWGAKGRELFNAKQLLDPVVQRQRTADGLDQDMAALRLAVQAGEAKILDIMPHLKWLYRERARLIGTDAPTQSQVSVTGGLTPDPEVEAQLDAAARQAAADIAALRNGRP